MSKVCEPGERKFYKLQAELPEMPPVPLQVMSLKEWNIYRLVLEGYTLREVAQMDRVSYGCVWKTVHRVKNRLKARQEAQ
jgi:DNA-binding CsgD family transcriptional regulator